MNMVNAQFFLRCFEASVKLSVSKIDKKKEKFL